MADEKPRPPSRGRLHLVVVSHDRTLLYRECDEVGLPGRLGDLGILPGHAAYVGALRPGVLTLLDGRDTVRAAISAGFCEVIAGQVTARVDDAPPAAPVAIPVLTALETHEPGRVPVPHDTAQPACRPCRQRGATELTAQRRQE